jgi:predicted DNA-binding protein with PD1-like motif
MKAKTIHEAEGQRTFAVILQSGDEVVKQLKAFAGRSEEAGACKRTTKATHPPLMFRAI